jgi:hypothetical protein
MYDQSFILGMINRQQQKIEILIKGQEERAKLRSSLSREDYKKCSIQADSKEPKGIVIQLI